MADRGTGRRHRHRPRGRDSLADPALPDEAGPVRVSGDLDRRPGRLHAGDPADGRRRGRGLPAGAALHAADAPRHHHAAARRGRASWSGAAVDPETGYLYVPSFNGHSTIQLTEPEPHEASTLRYIRRSVSAGPVMPRGLPLWKPPYTRMTAIDMNTGEHAWMIPTGRGDRIRNHPMLRDLDLPPLGGEASRSGPLLTKTLLIHALTAGGTDGGPRLVAYDKATGAEIASIDLPGGRTRRPDDLPARRRAAHRAHRGGRGAGADCVPPAGVTPARGTPPSHAAGREWTTGRRAEPARNTSRHRGREDAETADTGSPRCRTGAARRSCARGLPTRPLGRAGVAARPRADARGRRIPVLERTAGGQEEAPAEVAVVTSGGLAAAYDRLAPRSRPIPASGW